MPAFWSKLILRGHYNTRWNGSGNNKQKHKRKKPKEQSHDENSANAKLEARYYPNHVTSVDDQASGQYQCTRPRLSGVFPELKIGRSSRGSREHSPDHYSVADVTATDEAAGGINHYLPKITQNLSLSGLLEGNKEEDYFQSCRSDNVLDNFGRLTSQDDDVSDDDHGVSLKPSSEPVRVRDDKLDSVPVNVGAEVQVIRPFTNGALDASYTAEEYTHYEVPVTNTSQHTQNGDEWMYNQAIPEQWTVVDVLY